MEVGEKTCKPSVHTREYKGFVYFNLKDEQRMFRSLKVENHSKDYRKQAELDMVAHACNSSTLGELRQEVSRFKLNLGYLVTH